MTKMMSGKKKIAFLCLAVVLSACMGVKENEKDQSKTNDMEEVTKLNSFTSKMATELFANSTELSKSENFDFTPTRLNDQGLLVGEMVDKNDTILKYVGYQNVETGIFKTIKELDQHVQDSHANILAVNDDYICFSEVSSEANHAVNIFLYDIKNDNYEIIYEFENGTQNVPVNVSINENTLYIAMPTDNISLYNIIEKKWEEVVKERSSDFVILKNNLYYVTYENNDEVSNLYKMNLESKKQEKLLTKTTEEGLIRNIESDEDNLYLFLKEEYTSKCYIYDVKQNDMKPYFQENPIENPVVNDGFMVWWGNARTTDRSKSQYYLLDIKNDTNYIYDDSLIFTSKKGIVWVRFNVDEREIPPHEIFKNDNSSIMFCEENKLIK